MTDAREVARRVAAAVIGEDCFNEADVEVIAAAIEAATREERERCAGIAENSTGVSEHYAKKVAARIREGWSQHLNRASGPAGKRPDTEKK